MKGELDPAELIGIEPVADDRADPGKDGTEHGIVVEDDFGEHHTHHRVRLIPAGNVGFAGRPLNGGEQIEQEPALVASRLIAPGIDEQEHEGPLRALAALALARDDAVKDGFAQHFGGGC